MVLWFCQLFGTSCSSLKGSRSYTDDDNDDNDDDDVWDCDCDCVDGVIDVRSIRRDVVQSLHQLFGTSCSSLKGSRSYTDDDNDDNDDDDVWDCDCDCVDGVIDVRSIRRDVVQSLHQLLGTSCSSSLKGRRSYIDDDDNDDDNDDDDVWDCDCVDGGGDCAVIFVIITASLRGGEG